MEGRRVTRGKRIKYDRVDYGLEDSEASEEQNVVDGDNLDEDMRKSRIRDTNKEFAKRMTILQTWSEYWIDYTTREGDAYSKQEAKSILKKAKKITCPIASCKKAFTTIGGLRYHYARCNIDRCFKCKVCQPYTEVKTRGDLLRHMIRTHIDRLPPLKDEQAEIAQSFLATAGKSERAKFRRSVGDAELSSAQPSFYIKSYVDLIANMSNSLNFDARPYRNWYATSRDWDLLLNEHDRRRFFPPESDSVLFKTSRNSHWMSLSIGSSTILNTEEEVFYGQVFFTGGVNTAAAWAPRLHNKAFVSHTELLAIAVNSCPMDRTVMYKDMKEITGCIQFWSATLCSGKPSQMAEPFRKPKLEFMIAHNFGVISAMNWCPLGASWDPPNSQTPPGTLPRLGLLAIACGDAQVRIISVPHLESLLNEHESVSKQSDNILDTISMFRVKPAATLMPPGIGSSTDYQPIACTSISWNVDDNQRLIAAGYSNGDVALFDLANSSPILYSNIDNRHVYQSYRRWQAHLLPVVGVGILSSDVERTLLASGGRDRLLRMWDSGDIDSSLTYERAPITNLIWDYRLRGVVTSSEAAFTSFLNRVSYRYPSFDGSAGATVSVHRATVYGLSNSLITSAIASSDEAGEVFVQPTGRPNHKKAKNMLDTFSLYTFLPRVKDVAMNAMQTEPTCQLMTLDADSKFWAGHPVTELIEQTNENADPNNEDIDEANVESQVVDDYTYAERSIANKPAKFLLPIDERAIETYKDFKDNFALEYVEYDEKASRGKQRSPEAWVRASNAANIYCDRVCDYPFSSIKHVSWSPNVGSYSHLLSISHIGFCRIDRIKVLENIYKSHIDTHFG